VIESALPFQRKAEPATLSAAILFDTRIVLNARSGVNDLFVTGPQPGCLHTRSGRERSKSGADINAVGKQNFKPLPEDGGIAGQRETYGQNHLFVGSDIYESRANRISYLQSAGGKGFWAARVCGLELASKN
jgi:hypothetical protein